MKEIKGNSLTITISKEAGIPVANLYGRFFTFETSDGVRVEMSRAQFERLLEGYRKGVEFEAYLETLKDLPATTLGEMDDEELAEYLEPTI